MKDINPICRIALVQAEPILFDKKASLAKTLAYIEESASRKSDLIVFPELFIPGYPIGMNFGFSMGKRTAAGRSDWKRYYDTSVVAGDVEFQALADAAKKYDVLLIQISTDYVFGGNPNNTPCTESQTPNPTGAYGRTKLHGEQAVTQSGCRHIILRTSWLYSE